MLLPVDAYRFPNATFNVIDTTPTGRRLHIYKRLIALENDQPAKEMHGKFRGKTNITGSTARYLMEDAILLLDLINPSTPRSICLTSTTANGHVGPRKEGLSGRPGP